MLASLRRMGADPPPFADPRAAHGVPMEGYFWRLTDAASGTVAVVLASVNRDAGGRRWGMAALALHPGGLVRSVVVDDADAGGPGIRIRLGGSDGPLLEADDARLRVAFAPDATLDAVFEGPVGWPRALGGVGLGHLVPGLAQYWHPHLLGAAVRGEARVGERRVALDGASAYAEKNWGDGFPGGGWWWAQAQGFERPDVCVALAGGPLRVGPVRVGAGALVARIGGDLVHAVCPPWPLRAADGTGGWRLRAATARHRVEVEARPRPDAPALRLPVPVPAERRTVEGPSRQHLAAELRVRVRRGGRTLFEGATALAGLELGRPVGEPER